MKALHTFGVFLPTPRLPAFAFSIYRIGYHENPLCSKLLLESRCLKILIEVKGKHKMVVDFTGLKDAGTASPSLQKIKRGKG